MSSKIKPPTLKGFRDFLPAEKRKRDWVTAKIKEIFELFGFEPLETPALEYASLLVGKYGQDADKLIYRFADRGKREVAMRYDQTVPLARVLTQNLEGQNPDPSLWRRYQIQPVWRADKPQQGRYREFLQCDADIIGNFTLVADAEILALFDAIYKNIGFNNLIIKVNDRQTLFSLLETAGVPQKKILGTTRLIDKLDKKDQQEISHEMKKQSLSQKVIDKIFNLLEKTALPKNLLDTFEVAKRLGVASQTLQYSPTLARGLDYYTGLIFEGYIPEYSAGSVGGGGRYDKLISDLTGVKIEAVGFGLGFDRTVEAAEKFNLIPNTTSIAKVLAIFFDKVDFSKTFQAVKKLRDNKIKTEIITVKTDINKQLKYADKKGIPFVLMIGPDEAEKDLVTLKNMATGKQETITLDQAVHVLAR